MKRLLLLLPILFFLSCGIFGKKEEYFPMGIGSVWNYFSLSLIETASSTDTIQKVTIQTEARKKDKLTTGEDVTEFFSTDTIKMKIPYETTYVVTRSSYIRESGNYILTYESKSDETPDTTLVQPLAKDKSWRVNSTTTATVISQEDVTVKAGTYKNAWKIELNTNGNKMYYWYANGKGMVKGYMENEYVPGYKFILNMELTSATIK